MDKKKIRFALMDILENLKKNGKEGVAVPRQDSGKFKSIWYKQGQKQAKHRICFPFIDLVNIMNFALDNTFIKDLEGKIWRQNKGIPMGDPHSPGMTIITCAWMEQEWMQTIQEEEKRYFKAKRYMDDVICFYSKGEAWDHDKFVRDITKSECYMSPLKLTDGDDGTFLETSFEVTAGNRIRYWLKNKADLSSQWRYSHFESHTSLTQKRSTMVATLRKVHQMASDKRKLVVSAEKKLKEFLHLKYPIGMLWKACSRIAREECEGTWITIRRNIPSLIAQ